MSQLLWDILLINIEKRINTTTTEKIGSWGQIFHDFHGMANCTHGLMNYEHCIQIKGPYVGTFQQINELLTRMSHRWTYCWHDVIKNKIYSCLWPIMWPYQTTMSQYPQSSQRLQWKMTQNIFQSHALANICTTCVGCYSILEKHYVVVAFVLYAFQD